MPSIIDRQLDGLGGRDSRVIAEWNGNRGLSMGDFFVVRATAIRGAICLCRGANSGGLSGVLRAVGRAAGRGMASDLSKLDLLIFQIGGLHIGDDLVVVAALGIDEDVPDLVRKSAKTANNSATELAHCFLRLANLPNCALDRLSRYEATLWRQAGQILFALDVLGRRKPWDRRRRFRVGSRQELAVYDPEEG